MKKKLTLGLFITAVLAVAQPSRAQSFVGEGAVRFGDAVMQTFRLECGDPSPVQPDPDPLKLRALKYATLAVKHRLSGLASYYSTSLDGTLTANGERYHNKKVSAAHLTLPLGSWVEVTARATGRKLRLRVNDRGPYVKKFAIDLSQAAAHFLGVDVAEDRYVMIRIIGLPGEDPLPADVLDGPKTRAVEETASATLTPANR
jgi:rare lipoprotein A (peptidoglycan hydrolase)